MDKYTLVIVGILLKGEPGLVLGSLMARKGEMSLSVVIVMAIVISFGVNFIIYILARWKGRLWIQSTTWGNKYYDRTEIMVRRYGLWILIISRFLYGIRNGIPLLCGITKMRIMAFTLFNIIGAALWAISVGYFCWYIGESVVNIFQKFETIVYTGYIIIFIILPVVFFVKKHIKNQIKMLTKKHSNTYERVETT